MTNLNNVLLLQQLSEGRIMQCPNCSNQDSTMMEYIGKWGEFLYYWCNVCSKRWNERTNDRVNVTSRESGESGTKGS